MTANTPDNRDEPIPIPAMQLARTAEALEAIGTPEARELLTRLVKESPEPVVKQQAKASLERLERKGARP